MGKRMGGERRPIAYCSSLQALWRMVWRQAKEVLDSFRVKQVAGGKDLNQGYYTWMMHLAQAQSYCPPV